MFLLSWEGLNQKRMYEDKHQDLLSLHIVIPKAYPISEKSITLLMQHKAEPTQYVIALEEFSGMLHGYIELQHLGF
jgi:hypothetical protein